MSLFTRGNFLGYDFSFGVVDVIRGMKITMPKVDGVVYKMRNWIATAAGVTGSAVMGIYDDAGNYVQNSQTNIRTIAAGNNQLYYDYVGKCQPILKATKTYYAIVHAKRDVAGNFYLTGQSGGSNLWSSVYAWTDGTLPTTAVFASVGNYIPNIMVYMRMRGRPAVLSSQMKHHHTTARAGLGLETYLK